MYINRSTRCHILSGQFYYDFKMFSKIMESFIVANCLNIIRTYYKDSSIICTHMLPVMLGRGRFIIAVQVGGSATKQVDGLVLDIVDEPRRGASARIGHPVSVIVPCSVVVMVESRVEVVFRGEVGRSQLRHLRHQIRIVVVVARPFGSIRRIVRGARHPSGMVVASQLLVDGGESGMGVRKESLLQLVAVCGGQRAPGGRSRRSRSTSGGSPRHALHLR